LLAETLQEQGRWSDSLAVLDQAAADEHSDTSVLLRIIATQNLSYHGTEELLFDTEEVCKIIERADNLRVQIKGANALATITSHSKNQNQAKYLLSRISAIPVGGLNDDELSSLADSKARLYYYAYETDSCLEEIQLIESRLMSRRYVNTTMGSLHTGLGAVACCRGNYAEARNKFRDAYDIAARLGNDAARATRAIQVALCSLRLGEYDEVIYWGLVAMENAGSHFRGHLDCQCATYLGWSHALQNNHQKAYEAVSWLDRRLPGNIPAWLNQSWLLGKADTLLLLGQFRDAVEVGLEAVGKPQPMLHSVFQGGPFARWLAFTARGTSAEPRAIEKIQHMTRRLESFDALDQLEIVCAEHLLRTYSPATIEGSTLWFRERLSHLPQAVSQQLVRLGLITT